MKVRYRNTKIVPKVAVAQATKSSQVGVRGNSIWKNRNSDLAKSYHSTCTEQQQQQQQRQQQQGLGEYLILEIQLDVIFN